MQGTARRPYLLSVQCSSHAGAFESECSCPVGGACKHVAAALLKGLRERREPARPAPAPAPLAHAAALRARLAKAAPGLPPPPVPVNATPRRWTGTPQIAVRPLRADLPPPHAYGWGAVRTGSVGAARLLFRYGEAEVEHGAPAAPLLRHRDGELIETRRDASRERGPRSRS